MPQTTYNLEQGTAFAGLVADSRNKVIESASAVNAIDFGAGVVASDENAQYGVRTPCATTYIITDDAGAYTAGAIIVTINGVEATAVYNADKNTTLGDLATAIQALDDVLTAVYASGPHTITITHANDVNIATASIDITAITGAMTISSDVITSTDSLIRGVAVAVAKDNRQMPVVGALTFLADGYLNTETVNVLTQGKIWVDVADAVVIDSAVYLIVLGANRGKFTDETSGNIALPTATFKQATTGSGLAPVVFNMP